MRGGLARRLDWAVVFVFGLPSALFAGAMVTLYRHGAFGDVPSVLMTLLASLAAMMTCLAWIAHTLVRDWIRTIEKIHQVAELMAAADVDRRLDIRTGDEFEALAGDINRIADRWRDDRVHLERRVGAAAGRASAERDTLASVIDGLDEGVVVAARDGTIALANRAAEELLGAEGGLAGRSVFEFADGPAVGDGAAGLAAASSAVEILWFKGHNGGRLAGRVTPLASGIERVEGRIICLSRSLLGDAAQTTGAAQTTSPEAFRGAGLGREGPAPLVCAADRAPVYDLSRLVPSSGRRVSLSSRDRPLAELVYAVLDTETTGLNPRSDDRLLSLAAVRVRHGAVRRGEVFDALVCPARAVPPASTRVHGITDAMAEAAPPTAEVLPAFVRFVGGAVLVGHEIEFDLAFLNAELDRLRLPALAVDRVHLDTRLLSRLLHSGEDDHRLEAVAERLGVAVVGRHSALGDALIAAHILVRMLSLLGQRGVETLGQLEEALRAADISA